MENSFIYKSMNGFVEKLFVFRLSPYYVINLGRLKKVASIFRGFFF